MYAASTFIKNEKNTSSDRGMFQSATPQRAFSKIPQEASTDIPISVTRNEDNNHEERTLVRQTTPEFAVLNGHVGAVYSISIRSDLVDAYNSWHRSTSQYPVE